jgi:MHS family proline/betaine transporter-like MFS transporter
MGTFWTIALWFLALSLFHMGSGGEINGGAIYAVERSDPKTRGKASGLVCFYSVSGILLSAGCAALFSSYPDIAWQWPFMGGAILSASLLAGLFWARKQKLPPLPSFQSALSVNTHQVAVAFVVASLFGVAYYATFVYFTNAASLLSGISQQSISYLSVVSLGLYMISLLWSGVQSDKTGLTKMMGAGALAIAGCAPLSFWLVPKGALGFLMGQGLMALASGLFIGPSHALMNQLFPARFRYRGIAWTYTMAMTCVGAITPKICHWLSSTFPLYSLGWIWISLWGMLAFVVVFQQYYQRRNDEDEEDPSTAILACPNRSRI